MTVYGKGGQTRGFLNIEDTVRCIEIAAENPAEPGDFRVFNQFTEMFSVLDLAERVQEAAKSIGIDAELTHLENPRVEREEHYFNAVSTSLISLGLEPHLLTQEVLVDILKTIVEHKDRVLAENVMPKVSWK